MKPKTRIKDIEKYLAAAAATKDAAIVKSQAIAAAERAISHGTESAPNLEIAISNAREATIAQKSAEKALARIPAERRIQAAQTVRIAEEIGKAAARQGGCYSGDTTFHLWWGAIAWATTGTEKSDQYSRSCKYCKTNATHVVILCPAGVVALVEAEALRQLSARDGLHLIDLRADGSAVWVRAKGKAIIAESGWIAGNGQVCYHSTESAEHARAGFARKLAQHEKQQKLARAATKTERRARLIARLCSGAVATIADAKRLGYCAPGIVAFQSQHGIGDSCPLPQLIHTGNPSAVALALNIARKISTKKTLATT